MIDLIRQSSPIDVILVWLLVYFLIHFMPLIHSTPPPFPPPDENLWLVQHEAQ